MKNTALFPFFTVKPPKLILFLSGDLIPQTDN